jgi:5-methylcytosine-specific restriction protein B
VEGLRPVKKEGEQELGFELRNGIFKELCKKAKEDNSEQKYIMIIDEINRAEISKVFGELFYSIEADYRGEKGKVKTQYANMQNEKSYFHNKKNDFFFVPENVYIIGTMNDIDRSVEAFDFAIRRRFAWKEIEADKNTAMLYEKISKKWAEEAENRMQNLNNAIIEIESLNKHYHIGPAYFLKINNYNGDFQKLWDYHIEPLLREYMRGLPEVEDNIKRLNAHYELNESN